MKVLKAFISVLVGYTVTFLAILLLAKIVWNLFAMRMGLPSMSLWDMALLFAVVNLIRFDWLKHYNQVLFKNLSGITNKD